MTKFGPGSHKKDRLPVGVVMESRRYIGFARMPVQEARNKPVIVGLSARLADVER